MTHHPPTPTTLARKGECVHQYTTAPQWLARKTQFSLLSMASLLRAAECMWITIWLPRSCGRLCAIYFLELLLIASHNVSAIAIAIVLVVVVVVVYCIVLYCLALCIVYCVLFKEVNPRMQTRLCYTHFYETSLLKGFHVHIYWLWFPVNWTLPKESKK